MRIELATDEDALLSLEEEWEALLPDSVHPSIFMSFDYQYAGWKTFHSADSRPMVVSVRDESGALVGIAPFRSYRDRGSWARWVTLEYLCSYEIDRPAPVIRRGREAEFWAALQQALATSRIRWSVLRMPELPVELVPPVEAAFAGPGPLLRTSPGNLGIGMDLRPRWDEFMGKHARLRKRNRKVERERPNLHIRLYDDPARILDGFASYIGIEGRSWKAGKVGVSKDARHAAFYREVLLRLARRKRVAIRILTEGDREIAGDITYAFGRRVYFHHGAYEEAERDWSPGNYISSILLRDYMACGYESGDFLCGFAEYMRPWCELEWRTVNVSIMRRGSLMRIADGLRRMR